MTLTVKLVETDQRRLEAIALAMRASNQSEVIRTLINEKFEALQSEKTLAERRGGHPQHLLEGDPNLSDRARRKAAVAEYVEEKARRRG